MSIIILIAGHYFSAPLGPLSFYALPFAFLFLLLTNKNALIFLLGLYCSIMNDDDPESNPHTFDTYGILQLL